MLPRIDDPVHIGFDGLVRIASRNGLISYRHESYKTRQGLEASVELIFKDGTEKTTVTMADALAAGSGKTKVWEEYPAFMLERFAVRTAIEKRFKREIEETKKRLSHGY
jgi:hypothetical protein